MDPQTKIKKLNHLNGFDAKDLVLLRFQTMLEGLSAVVEGLEKRMDEMIDSDNYKLYSPKEVAEMLTNKDCKVHKNTVLKWLKNGQLDYLEGTTYKIPGIAIKKFIEKSVKHNA